MRERIKPEVVSAVERYAKLRIEAPTNKQIRAEFPKLSQTTLSRILRAARRRLNPAMARVRQSIE